MVKYYNPSSRLPTQRQGVARRQRHPNDQALLESLSLEIRPLPHSQQSQKQCIPPSTSPLHESNLVFNVIKLSPALEDPIPGQHPLPPLLPEIIDREEEWVMEEILDSKVINRKLRYLVKWEGYGIEHNSWEPRENVHAPDLVTEFHQKHPGAP